MLKISEAELKENLDKYLKLAQVEEIEIILNKKESVCLCPKNKLLLYKTESLFETLPEEAANDKDISRE